MDHLTDEEIAYYVEHEEKPFSLKKLLAHFSVQSASSDDLDKVVGLVVLKARGSEELEASWIV